MKLNLKYNFIYIFFITLFFFLWDANVNNIIFIGENYNKYTFNYLIVILFFPILYNFINKKNFSIYNLFNGQKYIILFSLFVILHFFLTNFINDQPIGSYEIINLLYLLLLSLIFSNYREFISDNFEKILKVFLIILIFFSFYELNNNFNAGQCNNKFFLISFIADNLKLNLSNSIYSENSHLAMMMVGVIFSSFYILINHNKNKIFFLFLLSVSILIVLLNYSTTFFVAYLFCQIVFILFFYKKFIGNFFLYTILFLIINSIIFFKDTNCFSKISDIKPKDIVEKKIDKKDTNLTTLIYQRSAILTIDTLTNHPLGWGNDGMDNATINLLKKPEYRQYTIGERLIKGKYYYIYKLNLKDGLSNFFKILNEFGFFSLLILYFFIKYLLELKKINSYNIFIIAIFITMCVRGAGYYNGGFIFCIFEFIYLKNLKK